jgi:PAS domain S-box-containing protein
MSEILQTTHRDLDILELGPFVTRCLQIACDKSEADVVSQAGEAMISVDTSGTYVDANSAALELLGVSLSELLESPADRFAIEPLSDDGNAAFRAEWEDGGAQPLVGTAGIRRADGETVRVSYAIEAVDTGFRVRLSRVGGSPEARPSVYSVGDVLREWRAAERSLAELSPGTPDWERTRSEIDMLRGRYQELFRAAEPARTSPRDADLA